MPKPDALNRDFPQTLKESYDPALERLRVDALINDGVDALIINPDGSINVNTTISSSTSNIDSWLHDGVGVPVTLGQKPMSGSIPVVLPSDQSISTTIDPNSTFGVLESGTVETAFNEILAVATATPSIITTYTATQDTRIKIIEVSGTNIAAYTIKVNGTPIHKKRTYFGNLDNSFQFSKGYAIVATDIVDVEVLHGQPDPGDFSAFILVLKD